MTALACFRILIDANRETTDRLAPLVAKVAGA